MSENKEISPPPFYCSSFEPETIKESLQGIAFFDNSIILDSLGLEMYKQRHSIETLSANKFDEGRFLALIKNADGSFTCKTDAFGQELLFYYSDGKNWAISSSFFYLADKLYKKNIHLNVYPPSLRSFMAGNQSLFGGQLLSFRTGIKEIRLLPHNKQIEIDKVRPEGLRIVDRTSEIKDITSESEYKQVLINYVSSWKSRLYGLSSVNFIDRVLELSGGYDTRVNLAIFYSLYSKQLHEKISIITDERKPDDLYAATNLAKALGVQISPVSKLPSYSGASSPEQEFSLWRYGSAGVYLPLYRMRSTGYTNVLKVHGANYRGRSYVLKPALLKSDLLIRSLPSQFADSVKDEFLSSFDELGIDSGMENAMQEHYLAFRCRLHYGKNWHWRFRNLFVTPQLSPTLKKLTDWKSSQGEHPEQVTCDILYSTDARFATLPFDTSEKAFPEEVIQKSRQLKLDFSKLDTVDIKFFGEIEKPTPGPKSGTSDVRFRDFMMHRFDMATKDKRVRQIYGRRFIKDAKKQKSESSLLKTGKITAIIAAHEIVKLTS